MNDINFVISSLRGGGAERMAVQLCSSWCSQGKSVTLITLSGDGDDDYTLEPGIKRIALDGESASGNPLTGLFNNFRRIAQLRKILQTNPGRVVVGFSGTSNISVILASLRMQHRVVVAERNYPPHSMRPGLWHHLRKWLYRYTDHVVVQSETSAQWILSNTRAKKVTVIPNAIVWPLAIGAPQVNVSDYIQADQKLLLAVGNIAHQKGFDLLLKAVAYSLKKLPDWQLVIVGAGDSKALRVRAAEQQLSDRIIFVGKVGNIGQWYQRADAFVMSSRFEGFPNVLLEAMASGCAVVSFNCLTGPSEMIEHEHNGLLVEAENTDELSVQLLRLMENKTLRGVLGNNAKQVLTAFSPTVVLACWERVLEQGNGRLS